MAGKNTAVFGIYSNYAGVESGVDAPQRVDAAHEQLRADHEQHGQRDFATDQGRRQPVLVASVGVHRVETEVGIACAAAKSAAGRGPVHLG